MCTCTKGLPLTSVFQKPFDGGRQWGWMVSPLFGSQQYQVTFKTWGALRALSAPPQQRLCLTITVKVTGFFFYPCYCSPDRFHDIRTAWWWHTQTSSTKNKKRKNTVTVKGKKKETLMLTAFWCNFSTWKILHMRGI